MCKEDSRRKEVTTMIKYAELKIENGMNFAKDLGSLAKCENECFEYPFDKTRFVEYVLRPCNLDCERR